MTARLRPGRPEDAGAVAAIHAEGLATGHASFREAPIDRADWAGLPLSLVIEESGAVLGWAALSHASPRPVYAGVGEVSLYVGERYRGRGLGDRLLAGLVEASEAAGWWTLWAAVFPENAGSIRLHERHGFRLLGVRSRIGRMGYGPMAGVWRDTAFLERRSNVIGR